MPRWLGILLIGAAALLLGVYAWFAVVWLLSAGARWTGTRLLDVPMLLLAPHVGGWLVALALAVVAFVVGLAIARRRRIAWLGFAPGHASSSPPGDRG